MGVSGRTEGALPRPPHALEKPLGRSGTAPQQHRSAGRRGKDAAGRLHGNLATGRFAGGWLVRRAGHGATIALHQRAGAAQRHSQQVQQQRLVELGGMIQPQHGPAAQMQRIGHFHAQGALCAAIDARSDADQHAVAQSQSPAGQRHGYCRAVGRIDPGDGRRRSRRRPGTCSRETRRERRGVGRWPRPKRTHVSKGNRRSRSGHPRRRRPAPPTASRSAAVCPAPRARIVRAAAAACRFPAVCRWQAAGRAAGRPWRSDPSLRPVSLAAWPLGRCQTPPASRPAWSRSPGVADRWRPYRLHSGQQIATQAINPSDAAAAQREVLPAAVSTRAAVAQRAAGRRHRPRRRATARRARRGPPSIAASRVIDSGRQRGSGWTHAEIASARAPGVSGARCRTSAMAAAWAARSFVRPSPPAKGGRPQSKCHHRQPQA